jgi:AraC family transcriptional regulator
VEDGLAGDLSLAELAREANLSPHRFARLFKESTGLPPHRYVVGRRVVRAKGLLAGTDPPIADVSRRAGFATQAQLNHHLKRLLGLTPTAFRRQGRR